MMDQGDRLAPELLQSVLLHLHDRGFLASHPSVDDLLRRISRASVSSGLHLRTLLLDSIECLRPSRPFDIISPEWRHYVILDERYVKQRPLWEIQQKLALGERQMRREHQRALAALSMLVLVQPAETAAAHVSESEAPLVDAVRRLTPSPSQFALLDVVADVTHILSQTRGARRQGRQAHLEASISPPTLKVFTDRGILHQLLLKLSQLCTASEDDDDAPLVSAAQENGQVRVRFESPCAILPMADHELPQLCSLLAHTLGAGLEWQSHSVSFALPAGPRARTVLIIDDEPAALELFRSYLTGVRCDVITESRAENVLPSVADRGLDLVMLDVMMPSMDGWEVLQRLRHIPEMRDVPIVACSVLNDAEMAYALGAARFLKKPVLRHQLVHVVNELLNVS